MVCLVKIVEIVSMEIEDFQDFQDWIGLPGLTGQKGDNEIKSPARAETENFYCPEAKESPQLPSAGFPGLLDRKMFSFCT